MVYNKKKILEEDSIIFIDHTPSWGYNNYRTVYIL